MYDDENVTYKIGINWKEIAVKVILLILFLILLVALFPKTDLTALYDNIYSSNINTMKDAAKSYYTLDRLPKTVGESTSMSLKDMVDNRMLIRFTDKDGKTCDEQFSKVEVTKTAEDKYVLKVQLKCGGKDDYILETIGCTNVCTNGNCTTGSNTQTSTQTPIESDDSPVTDRTGVTDIKGDILTTQTIFYQHRQEITSTKTVYSCPDGYVKVGNQCQKDIIGATIDATPTYEEDTTITVDAKINTGSEVTVYTDYIKTKADTVYTCPVGYTQNGSYCIKYTDATPSTGTSTYTCPSEYYLDGTTCKKPYSATYTVGATSFSCPYGGDLSGETCILTQKAKESSTCPSGYSDNGSSCYKVYDGKPKSNYTCPKGGNLNGKKCIVTKDESYDAKAETKTTWTCPNGGNLNGKRCIKTSTSSYDATPKTTYGSWVNQGTKYYTSSNKAYTGDTSKLVYNGTITGAVCGKPCGNSGLWYKYIYYTRSSSISYTCPKGGNQNGKKCVVTKDESYDAKAETKTTYTCPNGGDLNGKRCKKTSTSSYDAKEEKSYTCPDGGTQKGSTCTLTAKKITKETCPSDYTKEGSICKKQYKATPSTGTGAYSCPSGGTLSGAICTLTTPATESKGTTTYSCPSGYTLNGTKCELKINGYGTDIYSYTCPDGYTRTGEGEDTKCSKVVKNADTYYCEDADATLDGDKCTKVVKGSLAGYTCPLGYLPEGTVCTKKTTTIIDATVETKTTSSYRYQWSTKSYIEGWEPTGKTKTESSTYTAFQK